MAGWGGELRLQESGDRRPDLFKAKEHWMHALLRYPTRNTV